LIAKHNINL